MAVFTLRLSARRARDFVEIDEKACKTAGLWGFEAVLVTLRQDLTGIHHGKLAAEKAEKKPFRASRKSNP